MVTGADYQCTPCNRRCLEPKAAQARLPRFPGNYTDTLSDNT